MSQDPDLLRRLLRHEIELDEEVSDGFEDHAWGRLYLNPSLPQVWDATWALVDRPGISADNLAALADEAFGSAGFEHRTVVVEDEAEAKRLVPGLESLGWQIERNLYMALRREPDKGSEVEVAEVGEDDVAELRRAVLREDLPTWDGVGDLDKIDELVDQLLELERRIAEQAGDRWFVAPAGEPAAQCQLLAGDGLGQVENVGTVKAGRQRGYARAVCLAAIEASRAAGHELTFIVADADDWPQLFYSKLGFDPIGVLYVFRRKPAGIGSAPS